MPAIIDYGPFEMEYETLKKFACLILILTLAACAGVRTWDGELRKLEGKPINDAVILYGDPDGEYRHGPATTYVWQDRKADSIFGPSVTSGAGYRIGRPLHNGSEFLWGGIEYYRCVIRATVVDGLITRITSEGDPQGCEIIHGFRKMPLGKSSGGASDL
ncbi:MAG TPA: hypothetical protein VIN59_06445 [Alphaproteobacteria bacterium]